MTRAFAGGFTLVMLLGFAAAPPARAQSAASSEPQVRVDAAPPPGAPDEAAALAEKLQNQRYLATAFGDHLDEVRQAMNELADRYEPAELNRIGFRLYEKFRPDVPYGNEGWGKRAVLDVEMIRAAT